MKEFWTCGPFKDCVDRLNLANFKMEQMRVFLDLLEEDKANQDIVKNGLPREQLLATLVQLDIDKKMAILLGVPDGTKEKTNEISRKTVFEPIHKKSTE